MAIGDIKVSTGRSGRSELQNDNIVPGQFGEGVAKAVSNLSSSLMDVATVTAALQERKNKTEEFDAQTRFLAYENEQARLQEEARRNVMPGAAGITNETAARVQQSNKDFLSTVPKRLQEQYIPLLESVTQKQVNQAFSFEYEEGNKLDRNNMTNLLDSQASEVRAGKLDLFTAKDNVLGALSLTKLPAMEQETIAKEVEQQLAMASYANEVERGQITNLPVKKITLGEPEPDVVLSGTGPGIRGLANTVAMAESGSRYDVRNDGSATGAPITDFSDHPRIITVLSDGTRTSAAGKYQIVASTWDRAATALGLTDFSPASQDQAFWWLAEQRFNQLQLSDNLSLEEALMSGDEEILSQVHEALKPEWVALADMSLGEFTDNLLGTDPAAPDVTRVPGIRNGAVGTPDRPDIWNDPEYASLSYDQKAKLYNDGAVAARANKTVLDKARKEQHSAAYNTAVMEASEGRRGLADEQALKDAGVLSDFNEVKVFRSAIDDWKSRVKSTAELQELFNNPGHVFTGADDKGFNQLLGQEGKDALGAMDQRFLNASLTPIVQRIGYIPSESAKVLETMVSTGTPQQRTFAMEALASYQDQNPQLLERTSGLSDSMKKDVGLYTAMKPFLSEAEIADRVKLRRDPAYAKQHDELAKAGAKDFQDNVDNATLLDALDSRLVGFDPVMPLTPQQQFLLRKEAEMLYAEGWAISANSDVALKYAATQLQRQWSMSEIGGATRMVRNGPETYYPTINGDHTWIDYITRRDLGLGMKDEFALVADGQTRQEAVAFQQKGEGNNASYMIAVKDAEGNYGVKMDASGKLPLRIALDPNDPELSEARDWLTSYKNLEGKVSNYWDEYYQLPFKDRVKLSMTGKLQEELGPLHQSLTLMREERMKDFLPGAVFSPNMRKQLLPDMEETAKNLATNGKMFLENSPSVAKYYEALVKDIKQLGGKVPGQTE